MDNWKGCSDCNWYVCNTCMALNHRCMKGMILSNREKRFVPIEKASDEEIAERKARCVNQKELDEKNQKLAEDAQIEKDKIAQIAKDKIAKAAQVREEEQYYEKGGKAIYHDADEQHYFAAANAPQDAKNDLFDAKFKALCGGLEVDASGDDTMTEHFDGEAASQEHHQNTEQSTVVAADISEIKGDDQNSQKNNAASRCSTFRRLAAEDSVHPLVLILLLAVMFLAGYSLFRWFKPREAEPELVFDLESQTWVPAL